MVPAKPNKDPNVWICRVYFQGESELAVWPDGEPPAGSVLKVAEQNVMSWDGFSFEQLYTELRCEQTAFIPRPVWDYYVPN